MPLTDREMAILDFERTWWTQPGSKEAAIRQCFDLSGSRYRSMLNGLLDSEDALAYDPLVVRRLRRRRDDRRRSRYEGRSTEQRRTR